MKATGQPQKGRRALVASASSDIGEAAVRRLAAALGGYLFLLLVSRGQKKSERKRNRA